MDATISLLLKQKRFKELYTTYILTDTNRILVLSCFTPKLKK